MFFLAIKIFPYSKLLALFTHYLYLSSTLSSCVYLASSFAKLVVAIAAVAGVEVPAAVVACAVRVSRTYGKAGCSFQVLVISHSRDSSSC